MAATERKETAAGKKIAKEVEKGVAKALMDKSPAAARATKKPKKAASSPSQPPGAPTKKRKRRSEWDDEHVATEPEGGIPIHPPIDDEGDDRPPPPLNSMIEVDVEGTGSFTALSTNMRMTALLFSIPKTASG